MTSDEIAQLAALLHKLAAEGLGTPHTPKEVFVALRGVVAQPTVELFIASDTHVLLTPRADRHFHGYHLPGGFVGVGESLAAASTRVAERELGSSARFIEVLGDYAWSDHPYASPLCLLCRCELAQAPRVGREFSLSELPAELIPQHRALIERWLRRR